MFQVHHFESSHLCIESHLKIRYSHFKYVSYLSVVIRIMCDRIYVVYNIPRVLANALQPIQHRALANTLQPLREGRGGIS